MVQLPESCPEDSEASKAGFKTIADIGKERIRRVIKKIEAEQYGELDLEGKPKPDLGFKVFETINITLVCDECLKGDFPEKCRHKLASMPRWLSSKKVCSHHTRFMRSSLTRIRLQVEVVRQLLAEVRTTIPCQHVSELTCGGVLWCRTQQCCFAKVSAFPPTDPKR